MSSFGGSPRTSPRGSSRGSAGSKLSSGVLTPRSRLSKTNAVSAQVIIDVMRCLDESKVANIRRCFMKHDNHAVDRYEFVRIMMDNLENFMERREAMYETVDRKEEEGKKVTNFDLVSNLRELFDEIDINGDQYVEWDEFTAFIVEKAGLTNHIGLDALTRFEEILKEPALRTTLTMPIEEVFYLQPLDCIGFYVEKEVSTEGLMAGNQGGPSIKLYNVDDLSVLANLRSTDVKGSPTAFEYVGKKLEYQSSSVQGKLAVSCTDSSIVMWSLDQNKLHPFQVTSRFPTPHTQCGLLWDHRYSLLYSASIAGLVHAWDVEKKTEVSCMYGHSDMVMNLCDMKALESISSCSLDRTICVWDLHTGARRQHMEGHQKGVLSLTYNNDYKLLLSAGFDHDAMVWSPFSPTVIFKLKGHKTSLVGIDSIEGTNQVVTADADGVYKIWDLRNFQCVQSFSSELDELAELGLDEDMEKKQVTSFCLCQERIEGRQARLIGSTRRLHVFEQGIVNVDTGGADDLPIQVAIFNPVLSSIITAHGRSIKIWNALIGKLEKAFFDITVNGSDITAICLDDRKRKFIVGDHLGDIQVHNYQSGALMKVFDPHASQITSLCYIDELKHVVSVSWDGAIVVHDEDPPDHGVVIRTMDVANTHRGDISCAAVSYNLTLIATGAADKTVRIWDFETGKMEAKLVHDHEINEIIFLPPYPLIAVADSAGLVWLYGVRGSKFKYHCAMNFHHFFKHEDSNSYMSNQNREDGKKAYGKGSKKHRRLSAQESRTLTPVLCLQWDGDVRLYTGGDRGQVACWNFDQVIKELGVEPFYKKNSEAAVQNPHHVQAKKKNVYSPDIPESVANMEWSVPAHSDSVSCLQFVNDPPSLLSSSHDHTVRIWGIEGAMKSKRIGSLLQELRGDMRHPQWHFPIDVESIENRRKERTNDIVKANEEHAAGVSKRRRRSVSRRKAKSPKKNKKKQLSPKAPGASAAQKSYESKFSESSALTEEEQEGVKRSREHRKEKNETFSSERLNSPAGKRLEELKPGGEDGQDNMRPVSPASASEEEVDFDEIGFQEFRREWTSTGRGVGGEDETSKDAEELSEANKRRAAANSRFSMASTKAIRSRANRRTKIAASRLDAAIQATREPDQPDLRNQRGVGNERRGMKQLEERLKRYGL
jgi:WD40 repeat protein